MSQQSVSAFPGSPLAGDALVTQLIAKLQSLASNRSGTSRPTDVQAGETWLDTTTATAWALKLWDGAADRVLVTVNTSTGVVTVPGIGSLIQAYDAATAKLNVAQEWTKPQRPKPVAVDITAAFDASANAAVKRTLAGNETVAAPSNTPTEGDELYFYITGASTYTLAWNATYKAKSGSSLPAAPAAGKTLAVAFRYDGTNWQHMGDRVDA